MSDSTSYSFSFSYDLTPQSRTDAGDEDLVAFDVCLEYLLPDQQVFLHSPNSGRQAMVTHDVLISLHQCNRFRTLKEHNQQLQKTIPDLAGQTEDINQVLNSVNQMGLMLSATQKAQKLYLADTPLPTETGFCCCILSCDRPQAVSRLLQSMAENHQFHDDNRYFLVDDSRQTKHQQQNRQLCESFSRKQQVRLEYFGPEEQTRLLHQLEQAFPDHKEGVKHLLGEQHKDKPTYGRTRNWALLLGSGGKLVVIDDDVLFQRVAIAKETRSVALTSAIRSADFFSSPEEWQEHIDREIFDPTAEAFTKALGRTLPEALTLLTRKKLPPNAFRQLNPVDYANYQPESRVLITSCGSVGDPGTSANSWLYLLDEDSRQNLYASENRYRQHIQNRNMWSGRKEYAFLNSFVLISQITGIDASRCLPPYFPLLRNEDLLFGEMLRYMHPSALQLDLPWAAPHLPLEDRRWKKHLAMTPPQHGLLSFSADMVSRQRHQNPAATPEARLQSLADQFHSLADMADEEFRKRLIEATLQHTTSQLHQMHDILAQSPKAPDYWKTDMQAILQSLQNSLTSPPNGLVDLDGDAQMQRNTARYLWRAYAKGLQAWSLCTEWMQNNR